MLIGVDTIKAKNGEFLTNSVGVVWFVIDLYVW